MERDTLVTGGGAVVQFRAAQERIAEDFRSGRGIKTQDVADLQAGLAGAKLAVLFGGEDQHTVDCMENWISQLQMGF